MHFNYLNESLPSLIDRLRSIRISEPLRTPLGGLATAIFIVAAWWHIEHHLLTEARGEVRLAQARLLESRKAVALVRVERKHMEEILDLDARLRTIRRSGASLGAQLADLGDHLPEHVWLLSLSHVDSTVVLSGKAAGLRALSQTVKSLASSKVVANPSLVRAATEGGDGATLVSFEMRAEQSHR